ncbi:MAG: tetratricopeptide repeat protein [Gammaproteobacteria bacterium]
MLTRLLPSILLVCFTLAAAADEDVVASAKALVDAGRASEAYALLKPLESERSGESDFDYVFGIAALDAGQPLEAVFALERVVDANPDNGPARAELARAYLALGETDDAQDEFDRVKQMDLPPEARQTIERYLSSIDAFHDRTRVRFRPWVQTGFGYDTNVNGAADDEQVPIPIFAGQLFNLTGTENSPVWTVGAGTRFTAPLDVDRGLSLFGRIGLDHRLTVDEADFSSLLGNGNLGVHWRTGKHQLSVAAEGSIIKIDGDTGIRGDRESAGISTQWQYSPNDTNQLSSFAQFSLVRYPEQRVRDVNRFTGGVGWGHVFADVKGTPIVFGNVFGGFEDAQSNNRGAHFGRDFFGVRAGGSYRIGEKHTVFTAFTYQHSDYDEEEPTFLVKRDDDFFDVNVGYRFQYDRNWSVSPTITYNNNDSNIVITDYDRFEVMVTVRNDF